MSTKTETRAIGALLALLLVLPLAGCHTKHEVYTKHDIHITLDIRQIEMAASEQPQVASLTGSRDLILPNNRAMQRLAGPIDRRKARSGEMKKLLAAKSVGENNMGKLEVRSEGLKPSSPDNKRILDLMVAENKDREDIYKGYAQAHSMNEQDAEGVRHSWAALRRESLKPGEWFQVPMKQKQVEEFLKSNLGARFQKPPAKGAWVQIPSRGKTMPGTTGKTVGSMAL